MDNKYYIPVKPSKTRTVKYKTYSYENPTMDFMKYHKIVIRYIVYVYQIKRSDLDMLFYLYSEHVFSKKDVIFAYKHQGTRNGTVEYLLSRGFVCLWADKTRDKTRRDLYHITMKGKKIVSHCYELLKGEKLMKLSGFESSNLTAAVKSANRSIKSSLAPHQKLEQRLERL